MPPNGPPGPDAYDADLSAAREAVDDLGVGLAVWSNRREPDAAARRAASDAVAAIDETLAALYRVRARLVGEIRDADDRTAARADALLAKMRDGPRETEGRQRPTPAAPSAEVMPSHGTARRRHGGELREAAP